MRTTFYTTEGDGMFTQIAAIAIPPALVVVETEDSARRMRDLIHTFGQKCLKNLVELHPMMNADEAHSLSVEVRTVAEIETMEFNERQAMEV